MQSPPARRPIRPRLLAIIVMVLQVVPAAAVLAQPGHKQVFVLYSTRRDAQISLLGESELPRSLDVGLERNLDYYAEFIDQARFPDPRYKEAFRDFLRLKYQGVKFDVVIALQDDAIEFVRAHREALFSGAPVVYLATNPAIERLPNSTGLVHERNFLDTLEVMRELQPDLEQVFVVTGAGRSDQEYEQDFRRQVERTESGLRFTYLSGLETRALLQRLSTLPRHSAVYHLLVTMDGNGDRSHPLEYVGRVAAAANVPTYCWVDSAMGRGILGGGLYSQQDTIAGIGALALRVLLGEPADAIAITAPDLIVRQVDWRQLRRWGIAEARVPEGVLMRFQDPTLWDRYRPYLLAGAALLLLQSVLIGGLLIQRAQRRKAENDLWASQRELRRSARRNRDLGARLLKAQETERSRIAGELHDDLCQRMLLLTIELEALGRSARDERAAADALAMAQDIARSLHELSHQLHPTRLKMIGLVASLERLCAELSRTGIAITFTHEHAPPSLAPDVMLCLFRVVQEALQNAIKYSRADRVQVHLRGGPGDLTLSIEDNGVGLDLESTWGKGVGLVSMVERMEAIGGSLTIESRPGAGTRVTATLPVPPGGGDDEPLGRDQAAVIGPDSAASTSW